MINHPGSGVVLRNCTYKGKREFGSVNASQLADMMKLLKIEAVLVDNLSELRSFVRYIPSSVHIVEVCNQGGHYVSIVSLAKQVGWAMGIRIPSW